MYLSDELFQRSREGYFGVYFPSCEATTDINTKVTLEWPQKQFVTSVHTLSYFITNPQKTIKTIFTHRPRVSLTRFSFCRWCHNRLLMTSQWPINCDAITWIVISNSLHMDDMDFIHGDINGQSCKKMTFVWGYRNDMLRARQNGCYIEHGISKVIFLNENCELRLA